MAPSPTGARPAAAQGCGHGEGAAPAGAAPSSPSRLSRSARVGRLQRRLGPHTVGIQTTQLRCLPFGLEAKTPERSPWSAMACPPRVEAPPDHSGGASRLTCSHTRLTDCVDAPGFRAPTWPWEPFTGSAGRPRTRVTTCARWDRMSQSGWPPLCGHGRRIAALRQQRESERGTLPSSVKSNSARARIR